MLVVGSTVSFKKNITMNPLESVAKSEPATERSMKTPESLFAAGVMAVV
jgi:hypothetical protein